MPPGSDYHFEKRLSEDARSVLFRGRATDGRVAIVKALRGEPPAPRDVEVLRHEYQVAMTLDVDGVLRPQALGRLGGGLALVFEDFDGLPLRASLEPGGMEIAAALAIAAQAADVLAEIHRQRIIHKNVHPDSLLLQRDRKAMRLIDFSLCSELHQERATAAAACALEGDLRYVSPEQTGRMNRAIDHRSDLYSLGVTLYEMLTGRVPFESLDAMELVHAHIARQPVPPTEVRPEVPGVVSDLVMKLLSKRSEDRYQSASGLGHDLCAILEGFMDTGTFAPMELGATDLPEQLSIPETLLGRELEIEALLDAFGRAASGRATFLVVAGYSGVGKSALIREVHRPIVARRGEFVSGKFDQFRRETPYSALTHALGDLIRRILTEPAERVSAWRTRVAESLGESGGALVDFLPELELLVGPQGRLAALSPVESEARFRVVFERFVHAVATKEHPLALFIDDLQWADLATLELIQRLVRGDGDRHLLVIGAYRDNEVDENHPLHLTLDALRRGDSPPIEMTLQPLACEHVAQLVAATLRDTEGRSAGLAELVHGKTGGNPFFVQQFVTALYEDHHLAFDADAQRWRWDLDGIRAAAITSNVVELMTAKIDALPDATAEIVRLASCLGNEFDIATLAVIASKERLDAAADLWPAISEGLVVPMGDGYRFLRVARGDAELEAGGGLDELNATYRFLHDRVQQAAYESIPEDARTSLHLRIGRLLRERLGALEEDERLFGVVNHLNAGAPMLESAGPSALAERLDHARLNRIAGERARASSAWAPAASYFAAGRQLLAADAWETEYELALDLHRLGAEAEYMRHDVAAGEALVVKVLAEAREPLDTISVYELRINDAVLQAKMSDAVSVALDALAVLGVRFPRNPGKLYVLREVARIHWMLLRRSRASLLDAPEMQGEERLASVRLLLQASTAAYQSDPNMLGLMICKQMEIILRHGNCPDAPQSIGCWSILVGGALAKLRDIYDYGELAVDISRRYADPGGRGRAAFQFSAFSRHWRDPMGLGVAPLAEAARLCAEGGDLQFYAYSVYHGAYTAFHSGAPLPEMAERFERCQTSLRRVDAEHALPMGGAALQWVMNLRGASEVPALLEGRWFSAEAKLVELEAIQHQSAIAYTLILQGMLAYHFGEYERAARLFERAWPLRDTIMTLPIEVELIFFEGLTRVALARAATGAATGAERRRHGRVAARRLGKLSLFARRAPSNFAQRRDLLRAELCELRGHSGLAATLYEGAVAAARVNGFVQDEALAAELAFEALSARGRKLLASAFLRTSIGAYARWGANAKVDDLHRRYPGELVQGARSDSDASGPEGAVGSTVGLDVGTVVMASQVISREIVLDRLLSQLLRIVIQNAGAQRGVLLRIDDDGPVVEARGDERDVELGGTLEPLAASCASRAVLDYVVRTREALVLDDAQHDPRFRDDPYVSSRGLRSVLAVPTLAKDAVTGVLYVENDLSAGAFTDDRVELLRMIASQAAISLSNARLYTDIAELNRSYERFVPRPFLGLLGRASIVDVLLGDHVERELTILFADIRGFTSLSESMRPGETFDFINEYLGRMEPAVRRRGGVIDKYVGDAIMALFEGPPDQAVRAALDMTAALAVLNAERVAAGKPAVRIGIGVNRGRCMLGTIGGHDRMDGTVIGDAVNVAARLESLTKDVGACLLLSEGARSELTHPDAFELRPLGSVTVKGRSEPVIVHEVLDALPSALRDLRLSTRPVLRRALASLEQGDRAAAAAACEELLARDGSDDAAQRLLGIVSARID